MKTMIVTLFFVLTATLASATQEKKITKIRISGPGGFLDETTIYFDVGVTPLYTGTEDAPKVYSNIPNVPTIYSVSSDNVFCSVNGYSSLSASVIIPLGIKTDTAGIYVFTASVLSNIDPTTIVQLEDRQENIFTDLRNNFYPVQLADSETLNERFFLHVSRPIHISTTSASCANDDGAVQIDEDNSIIWTASKLFDSTDHLIDSFENISGAYSFSSLPESEYNLTLIHGDYAIAESLHVTGNYVVVYIQPSALTAAVNQDIVFYTHAHNATDYKWDMGDETRIGGVANPTYAYLQPGIYKVTLVATNPAGCEYKDSVTISISSATSTDNISDKPRSIWAYDKTITVVLNEEIKQGAELKIYNLLGQPVYYNPVTQITTEIILADQPTGYYLVSLQNNKIESTERVFLGK